MNDITDKQALVDDTSEEDQDRNDVLVDQLGCRVMTDSNDDKLHLIEFFEKCERRSKPVVIRPEMIMACEGSPTVFESLPDIYQLGINFAERWLGLFSHHGHSFKCGACEANVECPNGNHDHVGCFVVLFKHDLDPNVGGLVLGICLACSEKTDTELYSAVVKTLGGSDTDIMYPPDELEGKTPWKQDSSANTTVLNHLTQDTVAHLTQYRQDHDLGKYLKGCEEAIASARQRLHDLTVGVPANPAPTPEPAEVAQDDVNLLVGKD